MKIIFLDVDGVLNRIGPVEQGRTMTRIGGMIGLEPELVERFKDLVIFTGAEIVLSSSWRKWPRGMLALRNAGIRFFSKTPGIKSGFRGDEIAAWLRAHTEIEVDRYAIIDDESDFMDHQPLFKCSGYVGLTEEIAEAVARHLLSIPIPS